MTGSQCHLPTATLTSADTMGRILLSRPIVLSRARGRASVSTTNCNWTWEHLRFVADLNGDARADLVGIGADGVWSCLNEGDPGFDQPTFQLVAFEANAGWRTAEHPRFVADLTGDGRADIV